MRPEFVNRIDEVIVFRQLAKDPLLSIAQKMFNEVAHRAKDKGYQMDPLYGARPLRRLIQRSVTDELALKIMAREEGVNFDWIVDAFDGKLVLRQDNVQDDVLSSLGL